MSRERDIRQAVVDLLTATGEFDEVSLGDSDPRGKSASNFKLATVDPASTRANDQWDAAPFGGSLLDCRIMLGISVRANDPKLRDDEAERLLNVVRNALNGAALVDGYTMPDFTKVKNWSWKTASADQRDLTATLDVRYLEEGWDAADVAE